MTGRKPIIAGNWKMHLGQDEGLALVRQCAKLAASVSDVDIGVFPGMLLVADAASECAKIPGSAKLHVGAQNCYAAASGAFTGEVSPVQLANAGVSRVLLGHSERRHALGEDDGLVARKLTCATAAGLHVTLCVGETQAERTAGRALDVVERQLAPLASLDVAARGQLDLAYEPVWAIGTGKNATPEQAQEMHRAIRRRLDALGGLDAARIMYGGSAKPDNCEVLAAQPDVEGFLVGGASLVYEQFEAIVRKSAAVWRLRG